MSSSFFRKAPKFWESRGPTSLLLWPLSWIYGCALKLRKLIYDIDFVKPKFFSVPIIIVGNIRVGGTGKTPIVIALAQRLSQMGWNPGIISRGYGSQVLSQPMQVTSESNPDLVGDESVLIASRTQNQFPIWVFPKRNQSIRNLIQHSPHVDVIISDDGLQNQSLVRWPAREGGRDIEFVVRDARGEGNHFLLPAGPLREPASRDRDATLFTGNSKPPRSAGDLGDYFQGRRAFILNAILSTPYQLNNRSNTKSLEEIAQSHLPTKIKAVAALGNPQGFFDDLLKHGVAGKCVALPDHASYSAEFFNNLKAECILITEKDAVKCAHIQDERIWVVPMNLHISDELANWIQAILQRPDPNRYTL